MVYNPGGRGPTVGREDNAFRPTTIREGEYCLRPAPVVDPGELLGLGLSVANRLDHQAGRNGARGLFVERDNIRTSFSILSFLSYILPPAKAYTRVQFVRR